MKIEILERDQIFGNSKLEVFEKRGTKAAISDYAIISGGFAYGYYVVEKKLENRTGYYWIKTDDGNNHARVVDWTGNDGYSFLISRDGGVRPALPFSSISNLCLKKVIASDGILEVEYGEYPQKAASKQLQKELEILFQNRSLVRTGKKYTRDKIAYNQYDQKFQKETQEEYEYNGKKYVRVKVNSCYDGDEFTLSNGEEYQDGDYVWIEVESIKWLVDERKNIAVSEELLFAGVQFKHIRDYEGDFKNSNLKWYLDTYFVKEIKPFKENIIGDQCNNKKIQEEKSKYQITVDKLQQELLELMSLMPNDLKIKIQDRYNQIIEEYNQNCRKEKNAILNNSLSFGIQDSYDTLYTNLLFLKEEIYFNKDTILKLKEILKYRMILDERVEIKSDNAKDIENSIQNIKFELQNMPIESDSYIKKYHDKIMSKLEDFFVETEGKYQTQLKEAFGYQTLSICVQNNPMDELKGKLEHLLLIMKDPLLQECLEILKSFYEKSNDTNICSLSDHIKTINYVVSSISSNQPQKNWIDLKTRYQELYSKVILEWIDDSIRPETKKELDTKFRNDLTIYISSVVEIQENNTYLLSKVEEVNHSYQLIFAPSSSSQEMKPTVSSLLMLEIIKAIPNFDSIIEYIDIKKMILQKVDEITKKLKYAKNRVEVDNIMQEYYKFLTDIWAQVIDIHSFEEKKVYIQKI